MSLQYLHTSARRGLEPGKSGFCCVARDADLPLDLGKELERLSRYEHVAGRSSPVILRYLRVSIHSGSFHILSRICDAGADYSKRNNHLAHHLVFTDAEAASLPDPATLLLFWKNWKRAWTEPPRILSERDEFRIQDLNTSSELPESAYEPAVENGRPRDSAFTIEEGKEVDLALHFRNELLTLPVDQRWSVPFTNFILTSDQPNHFLWRGNWNNRPLPYEFESQTSRTIDTPEPAAAPTPAEGKADPEPEDESSPFAKTAPKVEIPEELTAADRKRPKRKWTRRRFSQTLNLSLAILALLCCGTIAFLLIDFNDPADTGPPAYTPPLPANGSPSAQDSPTTREEWDALAATNRLYEEVDRALDLANQLAGLGDPEPLKIANTLAALKAAMDSEPPAASKTLSVPSEMVQPVANQWVLDSSVAEETKDLGLYLVHESLLPLLREPHRSTPIFDPLYHQAQADRFIPEDAVLTLKSIRRAARDRLVQNGIEAVTAAEDYKEQWQSLSEDPIRISIQKLKTAFQLDPGDGYFATDESGRLVTPHNLDISAHLKGMYEQFLLPRISSFQPTPEFREAMREASQKHDTVVKDARAILSVLESAEPLNPSLESKLSQLKALWSETFVRDDLMEETIINFNLERLANQKRSLAALQSVFTSETLAALELAQQVFDALEQAESSISAIDRQSRWALYHHGP